MKKALVIGGSSGLGLTIVLNLLKRNYFVVVCDRNVFDTSNLSKDEQTRFSFFKKDISDKNLDCFKKYIKDVDCLIITSGFGRVARFENLSEVEVNKLMQVDAVAPIRVIKMFSDRLYSEKPFYTAVVSSICGHISSPLFSVYGAAKSSLSSFINNLNIELIAENRLNRILDVSPGSFLGSSFNGEKTDLNKLKDFGDSILNRMFLKDSLFIPNYEKIYKNVIEKDNTNKLQFGLESYQYKVENNRLTKKPQAVIGYLSGTFDLFHIGHLNLLKKAKEHCDYLIVGVHKSGSWKGKETFIPFDERLEIVKSIEYVDEAHESFLEDSDAWNEYHYDKLFVGSDYQGSERFKRYEEFFKDKGVEIVYFPYTKGTSSTQLRERLSKK